MLSCFPKCTSSSPWICLWRKRTLAFYKYAYFYFFPVRMNVLSLLAGSAATCSACHSAWGPEFNPRDLTLEGKPTPSSCCQATGLTLGSWLETSLAAATKSTHCVHSLPSLLKGPFPPPCLALLSASLLFCGLVPRGRSPRPHHLYVSFPLMKPLYDNSVAQHLSPSAF